MRNIKINIEDSYDDTLRVLADVRHSIARTQNEYLSRRFEEVNFDHKLMLEVQNEVTYPDGWRVKPYSTSNGIVSECDLSYVIGGADHTAYGVLAPTVNHTPVFQLSLTSHLLINTVVFYIQTKRRIDEYSH